MVLKRGGPFIAGTVLVLTVVLALGCGDDGNNSADRKAEPVDIRIRSPLPEALSQGEEKPADRDAGDSQGLARRLSDVSAPARREVSRLDVLPAKQRQAAETTAGAPGASDADYDEFISAVLPLINEFWKKKTKQVVRRARYVPPGHLVSYNGSDSPGCDGDTSEDMSRNAYYCVSLIPADRCTTVSPNRGYCAGEDIIAWDTPGLLLPFYRQIGDLASALVLAHEWGHLLQARVFPRFNYATVIRIELQADCYAGAWALGMQRQGRVDIGAFNQTLDLFESLGGNGEAWLDPESHGNKYQRIRSFTQGFENDARGCISARFDAMLERIGLGQEGS